MRNVEDATIGDVCAALDLHRMLDLTELRLSDMEGERIMIVDEYMDDVVWHDIGDLVSMVRGRLENSLMTVHHSDNELKFFVNLLFHIYDRANIDWHNNMNFGVDFGDGEVEGLYREDAAVRIANII